MTTQDKDRIAELERENAELRAKLDAVDGFLHWINEPNSREETFEVRDYRHEAFRRLKQAMATPADSQQAKGAELLALYREYYEADRAIVALHDQISPGLSMPTDEHYHQLGVATKRFCNARDNLAAALSSSEGRKG